MIRLKRFSIPVLLVIACLICVAPSKAHAATSMSQIALEAQQSLERRMQTLVHAVDPEALVYVQLVMKKEQVPLPGTPFELKDLVAQMPAGSIQIEKIGVTILARNRAAITPEIVHLVKNTAIGLGPVPSVTVSALPVPPVKPSAEDMMPGWRRWFNRSISAPYGLELKDIGYSVFVLIAIGLFIIGLSIVIRSVTKDFSQGVSRLASALESSGRAFGGGPIPRDVTPPRGTALPATSSAATPIASSALTDLPEQGLLALLSDCYWGEFDSYAAYIWRRIPIAKKADLLDYWEFLEAYVASILGIPELNLNAEHETYYLSPLPIFHLGNKELTELVRKSPNLLMRLSSMRRASLELKAKERVELTRLAIAGKSSRVFDFLNIPPSPARKLRRNLNVSIRSIDEEKDVLALPGMTVDLMQSIPSLGWAMRLPQETLQSILQAYTAKELAAAWVGPQEVLDHLGGAMPAKKLELLKSYLPSVKSDRSSAVFCKIHNEVVASLTKLSPAGDQLDEITPPEAPPIKLHTAVG